MDLLEREQFLSELESMLAGALTGQGCLALISGEAGIGKTSLVECFTDAHRNSVQVLWGTCDSLFTPRPVAA
jgi:predicted ATPase